MTTKRRVLILGGGVAGLSTAWQITQGNWRERFDSVHVYQMGWRLGGKCATGRGANRRVEEHGIHLFGGGYWNTLPMMRKVYAEWMGDQAAGQAAFDRAFERQYTSIRVHRLPNHPKFVARLPHSLFTMDQAHAANTQRHQWLAAALRNLRCLLSDSTGRSGPLATLLHNHAVLAMVLQALGLKAPPPAGSPQELAQALHLLDRLAHQIDTGALTTRAQAQAQIDELQAVAASVFWGSGQDPLMAVVQRIPELPEPARGPAQVLLGWALALNFIASFTAAWLDVLSDARQLDKLDEENFGTALTRHFGFWRATVESDLVQATIRILYQFKDGDFKQPNIGAGCLLHFLLRTWAYAGTPYWFFAEGTGETVIRPLYEVLKKRGVQFHFFHQVKRLHLDASKKRLSAIEFQVQARTIDGAPYQPLDAHRCWPSRPLYEQLQHAKALEALPAHALESAWHPVVGESATKHLDPVNDAVVFAISLGAVPSLCQELLDASPDWTQMTTKVATVQTQSLQLWLGPSSKELGINKNASQPIPDEDTGLGAGLTAPYETFSDFSLLLQHEGWPEPKPRSLWYFADVQSTPPGPAPLADPAYPALCNASARTTAKTFIQDHFGRLLPDGMAHGKFDFSHLTLHAPHAGASDDQRLDQQYIRSNFEPSERYVQALSGTSACRLPAGLSQHFAGLYLAGDWTHNGLNVGCVEATVMSGLICGNALAGELPEKGVVGHFDRRRTTDGGKATLPK